MTYETKMDPLATAFDTPVIAPPTLTDAPTQPDEIDPLAELKNQVLTMRRWMEAHTVQAARPALAGGDPGATEAKSLFVERYLRRGEAHGIEAKSLAIGQGQTGGYAVPREIDAAIDRTLKSISPIRSIAQVVTVGSAGYRKLVAVGGVESGWVGEQDPRPETRTPTFTEIAPPMGELYANPAATQAMLDDAAFDVEGWLATEIAYEFAAAEGDAFVNGNGANRPRGFLDAPVSDKPDKARAFGELQVVKSGAAGGFDPAAPADSLVRLVTALRPPYRQGAAFVMNSATLSRIRTMKTADGAFLWQPGLVAGQPDTLMGYAVVEAEAMPDSSDGQNAIAFGNFAQGYLITERQETAILRDPFTHKPFVHFYATKRVGGQLLNSDAIKLMRFVA